jgi:hypothetical protein
MSETREPANADMDQAILCLTRDIASGRVEENISFAQKRCTLCNIFVQKHKKYHAAAGDSAFHRMKRPV